MTWHDGFPLTQCLFASSYIDRILCKDAKSFEEAGFHEGASIPDGNDLLHTILRAYCLALIKTCHFVHARITRERYFEVSSGRASNAAAIHLNSEALRSDRTKTSLPTCMVESYFQALMLRRSTTFCRKDWTFWSRWTWLMTCETLCRRD